MEEKDEKIDEPKLYLFSKLLKIGEWRLFREFKLLIELIFIRVAPEVPVTLRNSYSGPKGWKAGLIGFIVTFFFTFVVTVLGAEINGTLYGGTIFAGKQIMGNSDPSVIYFLDDYWNIVLYTLICPLYVGLTCWLSVTVVQGWGEINDFRKEDLNDSSKRSKFTLFKGIALAILILSVAFLSTTNYINDIMKLVDKEKFYWFLTERGNNDYQMRSLGVYYFLLNFSLLISALIALMFFMSIYSLVMSVGKALESKGEIGALNFEILRKKLSVFTEAYILTKGIVACFIINIWIWADSPLGKGVTENFVVAIVILTIIGMFMVSFPRYFVELQWAKLRLKHSPGWEFKYDDLRSFRIKMIAHVLDVLFIGGFAAYAIQNIISSS